MPAPDATLSQLAGRPITGSKANYSAVQLGLHVKVTPPLSGPALPWVRLGMGVYRTRTELALMGERVDENLNNLGFLAGVGVDFKTRGTQKLALDVTYHRLSSDGNFESEFTAFTFGARYMFGQW